MLLRSLVESIGNQNLTGSFFLIEDLIEFGLFSSLIISKIPKPILQLCDLNYKINMKQQDETIQKLKHQQQILQSSREQLQIKKKQPRDHSSNVLHNDIVKSDYYRKCIPFRQRVGNWFYNTLRCTSSDSSFVQKLIEVQRRHPVTIDQQLKKVLQDRIIKIKIIQTSRLQLDSNVIHPFVKVHVVDIKTGSYVQKRHEQLEPIIYHNESITFYEDRKYDASQNNIILPFATNPCDLRKIGNSICKWNQRFYINFPAERIFHPDTLFLFQLLDFNHQALLFKDIDSYDKDNFYRIAWGYLRPVGVSKSHRGSTKIQLYRYKFNNKKLQNSKSFIPSIYYDFVWSNHEKYEGYLTVQINETIPPKRRHIEDDAQYPQNLFQQQLLDPNYLKRLEGDHIQKAIEVATTNTNLLKFSRSNGICEPPKQLIYKLQSEKLGCFRTLFVGNYLYAACSTKKHTNIKVYSLQKGQKVMTLKGHRQILYSMIATTNQKYLITAGSDHIVRVWQIPSNFGQYIDQQQSQSLIKAWFTHTAAVYSTACIYVPLNDKLYTVTCCYDGFVRLWQTDLVSGESDNPRQILINNSERSPFKVYPTACVVYESNFFIIGDSIGDIRIFDFAHNNLNLRCHIQNEQLTNDLIIHIKILNKNNILVQASDNLIRHFQLSTNKLRLAQKFSGAQFQKQLCDFAVSPDNKYLISPSESGKPFMWDLITGLSKPIDQLNLDIKGPLTSCCWHPKYNLVAFGGFIQLCPIMVYGYVLSDAEQKSFAVAQLQ